MSLAIDYSYWRPTMKDLTDAGVVAVGRYYGGDSDKDLTYTEALQLSQAGIDIWSVFENAANDAATAERGIADGQMALAQARQCGQPENTAIYAAIDYPATFKDLPTVLEYLANFAVNIPGYRSGCYGSASACQYVVDNLVDKFGLHNSYYWQTAAWSNGVIAPFCELYQNGGTVFSGNADIDEIKRPLFGQWNINQNQEIGSNMTVPIYLPSDHALPPDTDVVLIVPQGAAWSQYLYRAINLGCDFVSCQLRVWGHNGTVWVPIVDPGITLNPADGAWHHDLPTNTGKISIKNVGTDLAIFGAGIEVW